MIIGPADYPPYKVYKTYSWLDMNWEIYISHFSGLFSRYFTGDCRYNGPRLGSCYYHLLLTTISIKSLQKACLAVMVHTVRSLSSLEIKNTMWNFESIRIAIVTLDRVGVIIRIITHLFLVYHCVICNVVLKCLFPENRRDSITLSSLHHSQITVFILSEDE